jgi:hypothetical protein
MMIVCLLYQLRPKCDKPSEKEASKCGFKKGCTIEEEKEEERRE